MVNFVGLLREAMSAAWTMGNFPSSSSEKAFLLRIWRLKSDSTSLALLIRFLAPSVAWSETSSSLSDSRGWGVATAERFPRWDPWNLGEEFVDSAFWAEVDFFDDWRLFKRGQSGIEGLGGAITLITCCSMWEFLPLAALKPGFWMLSKKPINGRQLVP